MPHALFAPTAALTGSSTYGGRNLIPGVEPGGSRAGGATKPAMLITSLDLELVRWDPDTAEEDKSARIFLSLSQDLDQDPDFLILIGTLTSQQAATAGNDTPVWIPATYGLGTVWAPRVVGVRVTLVGGFTAFNATVHLGYERIEVPWMDWFIMWEFLDGITSDALEF